MKQKFFDAHCDTGSMILENGENIKQNSLHFDLKRLEEYCGYIQVFAAFVDKKKIRCTAFEHCVAILNYLHWQMDQNKEIISLITSQDELKKVAETGGIGAILSIEGGEALEGTLENLHLFYQLGVRLITLTWNYANEISEGVFENNGNGLTDFGKKAVKAMENMGIVIDVSHLSETGFWDVAEHTKYPFVASHSNAKTLCNHPRNLTDEQITCIIKRKGCIGINFFPDFLSDTGKATMADIIRHMEYILRLNGEDSLGLGSDFDGVSSLPKGIRGVESVNGIYEELKENHLLSKVAEKICFGNFYRIFMETMGRRK